MTKLALNFYLGKKIIEGTGSDKSKGVKYFLEFNALRKSELKLFLYLKSVAKFLSGSC